MKAATLSLVIGLLVGAGATAVVLKMTAPTPPPPGPSAEDVAQLQDKLKAASLRVDQIETVNAELAAELAKLKKASAAASVAATAPPASDKKPGGLLAALLGGGSDTNRVNAMRKLMQAGMKQHLSQRLSALKFRLKLTDAQEEQLRAVLDRQATQATEMASKALDGKLSKDEMSQAGTVMTDFDSELKSMLTPEQLAEYDKYQVEERKNQATMMANMELSRMQTTLQLTDAQQEKVFNILAQNADQTFATDKNTNPADWQQAWQQREDAKLESLKTVLTPEQFAAYQQQKQAEKEMMKTVTESMGFGGGSNSAVSISVGTSTIVAP